MSPNIADVERNRQFDDVFHAITAADEPPTARDLALETHRSDGQVKRILGDLRERGRIRRFQDPEDGRVYRYEIVPANADQ